MDAFYRFMRFYNHILHRYKYPVQIATGGVLWCSGDILAQGATHLAGRPSKKNDDSDPSAFRIDWDRTGKMTLYGLCLSAPAYAFWYSFLDNASHAAFRRPPSQASFPVPNNLLTRPFLRILASPGASKDGLVTHLSGHTIRTWKIIGFKLVADGILFDPLYLSLFFTTTGWLEGKKVDEIKEKLRKDFLPTYLIDIFVWAPVQTLNFRFVPVAYQALIVQSCNVVWNAYLSFVQHRDSKAA